MDHRSVYKPARGVWISLANPTIVFVTVTTQNRERWAAQEIVRQTLLKAWSQAEAWVVGKYLLMPDHLYFFCAPGNPEGLTLNRWMNFWKGRFTRESTSPGWEWQSLHWDHRLRSDESYEAKWQYVVDNPVGAGLAANSGDWEWQGEVKSLVW